MIKQIEECPACEGSGMALEECAQDLRAFSTQTEFGCYLVWCDTCDGTGKVDLTDTLTDATATSGTEDSL